MSDQQPQDVQPPHSVEAEEAVLGSIIINPESYYDVVSLDFEDFYIVRNGWVWQAIQALVERNEHIDYLTVIEELRARGTLDPVGGPSYITYLINHTPATIYTETYGRVVYRASKRRKMLKAASEIAQLAHNPDVGDDLDDLAYAALARVTYDREERSTVVTVSQAMSENYITVEDARGRDTVIGIETDWSDLDAMIGGLQPTDLIIIAGRPGMGKTTWLITLFVSAMRRKVAVPMLFTMEMSREQVSQRITAMNKHHAVSVQAQRQPAKMSEQEWSNFVAAQEDRKLHGIIDDGAALTPHTISARIKRAQAQHGVDLVLVDYLQLARGQGDNRAQEVGDVARGLKNIAKDLRVPVVAAAQLNRDVEGRADKHPALSDLKESGAIEEAADIVMFVYRDAYYNPATEHPNTIEIRIAKHRHGPTGMVPLFFKGERMEICNLARRSVEHLNDGGYRASDEE